jgi:hypothetical protein
MVQEEPDGTEFSVKRHVPPRYRIDSSREVKEVPHGWEVTVHVRSLKREVPPGVPEELFPDLHAWIQLTRQLLPFVNLFNLLVNLMLGNLHMGRFDPETGEMIPDSDERNGHSEHDSDEDGQPDTT